MKYVLADITRRNISFHYYQEQNGNRAFVSYGTNGPIPLAISYENGRYAIGKPAQVAAEAGQKEAYYNLFDENGAKMYCNGLHNRQLVPKVITLMLEDLCRDRFNATLAEAAPQITLALLYGNDISFDEIENVRSTLAREVSLAELKVFDHSQESVKYFHKGTIDDWSGETDGMVVLSDNQDLSVKCYALSDYTLKYEHRYKNKGVDPRFEWAVNELWKAVTLTYCTKEESMPYLKKAVKAFLDSGKPELNSVRLPDGDWLVHLTRRQYDIYSPPGGNQFMTIAHEVVEQKSLNMREETTGIVLQGYAADNKSFRDSFISFDPISNENEAMSREIRNNILDVLLGGEEILEANENVVECPWNGGTIMVGVTSLPEGKPFSASADVDWIKTLVGTKEVAIIGGPNDTTEERVGIVTLASPSKKITQTIVVRQNHEPIIKLEPDPGTKHPKPGKEEPLDPNDNGNRKFKITAQFGTTGSIFNRSKTLTVNVEILDGKVLPFNCVFTLAKGYSVNFKPESMYYEYDNCERGATGVLTFGPYKLPISALGKTDVIYAGIWPAKQMPGNPLFRNNQLEIKL